MDTIICSNVFGNFDSVSDITSPINKSYADFHSCEYVLDKEKRCSPEVKSFWWEKMAFLNYLLGTKKDGSLVIWMDVDSILNKKADITKILNDDKELGMVPIFAGSGGLEQQDNCYNAGVIAIRNNTATRNFFKKVWELRAIIQDDEAAMMKVLPKNPVNFQDLDVKWNCWRNNVHLVKDEPFIKTFHGIYPASAKVEAINEFLGVKTNE